MGHVKMMILLMAVAYERRIWLEKQSQKSILREKCPYAEFFLVHIFLCSDWIRGNIRIQSEYRKIRTRKDSVFGHFSRSAMKQYISIHPFLAVTQLSKFVAIECNRVVSTFHNSCFSIVYCDTFVCQVIYFTVF